jgi:hypothetical protein
MTKLEWSMRALSLSKKHKEITQGELLLTLISNSIIDPNSWKSFFEKLKKMFSFT